MGATGRSSRRGATGLVALCYAAALGVALAVGFGLSGAHPLLVVAAADLAGTVVVFGFSRAFDNSSFYDPYWSVAPLPIAIYWWLGSVEAVPPARSVAVIVLLAAWGARLTWNWYRGWSGLDHEDWRYVDLRAKTGRAYWLVSLSGIHLFPTVLVYLGCLTLWPALSAGVGGLGWLDAVAVVVTAGGIAIEAAADGQLRRWRQSNPPSDRTLATGLWAYCRHPNYFGELTFWWGLSLFGLAADPSAGWVLVGPMAITLLFRFISLPMIDRRMLARRPDYAERMARVPAIVPWFPRAPDDGS